MFEMVLGHLVGDYLLQNDWMAEGKKKEKGLGWLTCTVHCILYTLSVCLFMWNWDIKWVVCVFLSHFLIDKFGFVDWYLRFVNGRSISKFLSNKENKAYTPHIGLRAGITVFVYILADNTMHLILMFGGYKLLY